MAALAVLLAALFEDEIAAVHASGGVYAFESVLDSPFCHLPADAIVPGLLTTADVADVAAALAPMPLRLARMVDGQNRPASDKSIERALAAAKESYRGMKASGLIISAEETSVQSAAKWLISQLKHPQ